MSSDMLPSPTNFSTTTSSLHIPLGPILTSQVDSAAGFKTSSILCMPISNAQGSVLGVAQFVNKLDGTAFNQNDENLFEVSIAYVP